MIYKSVIFFIFILSIFKTEETTELIIEMFRHGARREYIPKHLTELFGIYPDPNTAPNDLTNTGYKAHYFLGKAIRENYKNFLPEHYNFHNVEVYASNRQRTLQSANSQLLGIFDFGSGPEIEVDDEKFYNPPIEDFDIKYDFGKSALPYNFSVLPVFNQYEGRNTMFTASSDCPLLVKNFAKSNEEVYKKNKKVFDPLYNLLIKEGFLPSLYTGKEEYDITGAKVVCDIITSRLWSDPDFFINDQLKEQCVDLLYYITFVSIHDPELRKTFQAELFALIKEYLTLKSQGKKEELKLLLLSGHDINISAFAFLLFPQNDTFALDLYKKKHNPALVEEKEDKVNGISSLNYTANFIIELFKDSEKKNKIRIKYNNELTVIEGDKKEMLLDEFLDLLSKNIDEDFPSNCGAYYQDKKIFDFNKYFIAWLISFIVLLSLLVVLYVMLKNGKNKAFDESLVENDEEILI